MKRIGYAAVIAMLFSVPVLGQAQDKKPAAPAPAPATKAAATPAPAMKAEKETTQVAAAAPARKSRAMEDARACLQHPTNREIAVCAEEYR